MPYISRRGWRATVRYRVRRRTRRSRGGRSRPRRPTTPRSRPRRRSSFPCSSPARSWTDGSPEREVFVRGPRIRDVTRTLYRLEGCPHCEQVVDRLDELDLDFESIWVEALHSKRNEVKRVSGQR